MERSTQVIIVGGGLAGLSAALYLARAKRQLLGCRQRKIHGSLGAEGRKLFGLPRWNQRVSLAERARRQVMRYGAKFKRDVIVSASKRNGRFVSRKNALSCDRLLLARGVFHIRPIFPD